MPIFLLVLIAGLVAVGWMSQVADALAADDPPFLTISLPVILHQLPPPVLLDAWVSDQTGIRTETFRPGETAWYHIFGNNSANSPIEMRFQWTQTGDCGENLLFDQQLILPPGDWEFQFGGDIDNCLGSYTHLVTISRGDDRSTRTTNFSVVDTTSQIILSQSQGFEKCGLPSIEQMGIWAQESPYDVFNIYLGGDHFACKLLIDSDWVRATAQQGWDFILTWAGHGTFCWEENTSEYHPISSNPIKARREGRAAAEEAIAAARELGFLGPRVIYYDVEPYANNDVCRSAMDAFLEGWTERLHESGDKAGAYGSPCLSYIEDWWDNDPLLNDIWFARWKYNDDEEYDYDEFATVDDSDSQYCPLPDSVWPGRRIRQYAGDHSETYGPCDQDDDTCTLNGITSNVLAGEITRLLLDK
jgi:hypothetical protein